MPEGMRRFLVNTSMQLPSLFNNKIHEERTVLKGVEAIRFTTKASAKKRIILYFHGGGYHWGSPQTHRQLIYHLCEFAEATCYAPDYRLAPENPFPAALNDAVDSYLALLAKGFSANQIIVGGDSAGGGLTLALLLRVKELKHPMPIAAFCLSPWCDLTESTRSRRTKSPVDPMLTADMARRWAFGYASSEEFLNPLVSPLFGNFSGLPPILVHVGSEEILLDDAVRLKDKDEADITVKVWPEMIHVFHFFADVLPTGMQALKEIGDFIKSFRLP